MFIYSYGFKSCSSNLPLTKLYTVVRQNRLRDNVRRMLKVSMYMTSLIYIAGWRREEWQR